MGIPNFQQGQVLTAAALNELAAAISEAVSGGVIAADLGGGGSLPFTGGGYFQPQLPQPLKMGNTPVIVDKESDGDVEPCANGAPSTMDGVRIYNLLPVSFNNAAGGALEDNMTTFSSFKEGDTLWQQICTDKWGSVTRVSLQWGDAAPAPSKPWDPATCGYGQIARRLGVVKRDYNYAAGAGLGKELYMVATNEFFMPVIPASLPLCSSGDGCGEWKSVQLVNSRESNTIILNNLRENGGVSLTTRGRQDGYADISIRSGFDLRPAPWNGREYDESWTPCKEPAVNPPGTVGDYDKWQNLAFIPIVDSCAGGEVVVDTIALQSFQYGSKPWEAYFRTKGKIRYPKTCTRNITITRLGRTVYVPRGDNECNDDFTCKLLDPVDCCFHPWDFHVIASRKNIRHHVINFDAVDIQACNILEYRYWDVSLLGQNTVYPTQFTLVMQRATWNCSEGDWGCWHLINANTCLP